MMSTKEKILQKLDQIEDEVVLEELLSVIELELLVEPVRLSEEQKQMVNEGLEDIYSKRTYSDRDAKRIVRGFLKAQ